MDKDQINLLLTIDNKVDQVKDKLHSIEIVQTKIQTDLKYHIKRTDLLEDQVELMNKKVETFDLVKTLFIKNIKLISILAGAMITILTIVKLIKE